METKKEEQIKRQWNLHSRSVPGEFYDVCEIDWVIGEEIMLKKDFEEAAEILTTSQQQTIERLREMLKETTETLIAVRRHGVREGEGYETAVTLVGETIHAAEQLLGSIQKPTNESRLCEKLYHALQTFEEGVNDGSIMFGSTSSKPDDFAKTFMSNVRQLLNTTEPI